MNNINEIKNHPIIKRIYEISLNERVAVLRDNTITLLLNLVDEHHIKTCLEIGSGVGFSSSILNLYKNLKITTVEKDLKRFNLLKNNLKEMCDIKPINCDCFLFEPQETFDLIIIDGPKSKQITLIEKLKPYLNDNGIIFIDNIFLKKFNMLENPTKHQLKIINEIKELENYLKNYEPNKCKIYNIDDGVALIYK